MRRTFRATWPHAQASAATGVPFTLSTFSQAPMEEVIKHAGDTPNFYQLYLPADRELAASLINRAERCGYSVSVVTVDSVDAGLPALRSGDRKLSRSSVATACRTTTRTRTSPSTSPSHQEEDQAAALAHYTKIFANPLSWDDLRWIRAQTRLPVAVKGIQQPDDARLAIDNGADILYCTNHGGRQANSGISTLQLLPGVIKAAGSTPGDVRLRGAGCHRRDHRARTGCDRCRDRPPLRIRPCPTEVRRA